MTIRSNDNQRQAAPGPLRPKRILIESTTTFSTRFTTGIQRVVRNVVWEAGGAGSELGIECIPVLHRDGNFFDARRVWERRRDRRGHASDAAIRQIKAVASQLSGGATAGAGPLLRRLRKTVYPRTLRRWLSNAYWRAIGRPIDFRPGDALLLLDETWSLPLWPAVRRARAQGCRVGAVIYDLLPVDFPQFFKDEFAPEFRQWLETLTAHTDFFVAISESVRSRFQQYLRNARESDPRCCASFRLGVDRPRANPREWIRGDLRQLFSGRGGAVPYLAVGTIEPRKNHTGLLDAFDLLWTHFPEAKLCLVGRVGWKNRDVLDRISRHPRRRSSLFWFHDLSDAEVQFCYERAKAVVSASIAEGYGLPVVEGLGHGRTVLASDIPVHREAGGELCLYFDVRRPETLAALLADLESGNLGTPADSVGAENLPSWSTSCRELLGQVLQLQDRAGPAVVGETDRDVPGPLPRCRAA
jgi:alpha-1,2-rhamnosyltransferase